MTQSGSPQEPPPGSDQEEIWQTGSEAPVSPGGDGPPASPGGPSSQSSFAQSLTSTAAVPGPPGFYYADVPNRIIAYVIDVILLSVIGIVLAFVLGGLFGGLTTAAGALDSAGGELNLGAFLVVSIAQLAISLGYFGYSWTAARGTPGMKLLGLQIGDESDGHSIDWNQAIIRWLIIGIPSILATFTSYASSTLSLVFSIIGVAWLIVLLYSIAQSPTKQGLHDRYARTILVKAGRRAG
jgi:uncharacterized RDD family membrane protein YckC